jgi:uncharacterized membrane protein YhhN
MNDNVKNKFLKLNLLIFIGAMACLVFYDYHGGLWLKGVTSLWFCALGTVNLVYAHKIGMKKRGILYIMEAALVMGACADVLLGIEFMVGVALFALGHVIYMAAFFTIEKPRKKDLLFILPLALFAIFCVTGTPFIQVEDPFMEKMLLAYAVIISCMTGKALSNLQLSKKTSRKIIAVAGVLFLFSDLMLAVDMFGAASRLTWVLCSYTYWPAQNLLAHSMYHITNESKEK